MGGDRMTYAYKAVPMTPAQRELLRRIAAGMTFRLDTRTTRALERKRLILMEVVPASGKRYRYFRLTDNGKREAERLGFAAGAGSGGE